MYRRRQLEPDLARPGIFAFADWLPSGAFYLDPARGGLGQACCYRSEGLAASLGLRNLFVAFSGYWPERGAHLVTRSFKEFEAQATFARYLATFRGQTPAPLMVSSAGNTANAFSLLAHQLGLPLYLVVPETGLDKLVLPLAATPVVIAVRGDYTDAIELAAAAAKETGLMREGGARNVARRAGMACVMLSAVAHPRQGTGRLFDHYFQAVGSATGAIAAWEAVQLLRQDGRFGSTNTRIHMAQNHPFTPIVDSWRQGRRALVDLPEAAAKERIAAVTADVLTNRHPPYGPAGGIYDVLAASGGTTWAANNYHVFHAARLFRETEGVDIGPAAAVAVQALRQAIHDGAVGREEHVLLHVTGGGREIQRRKTPALHQVTAVRTVAPKDLHAVLEVIGTPPRIPAALPCLKPLPARS